MLTRSQLNNFLRDNWISDIDTFTEQVTQWLIAPPTVKVTQSTSTSRSEAGRRAAATRNASHQWKMNNGKKYVEFVRDSAGGVRIPRSFVKGHMKLTSGDEIYVAGSKGFNNCWHIVKNDGSLYITNKLLKGLTGNSFLFRRDGKTLILRTK